VSDPSGGVRPPDSFFLRPATPEDHDFLARLYVSTRQDELPYFGEALIRMQYEMRQTHYSMRFPESIPEIIMVSGERSGAIQLARSPEEIRIVDIALLPVFRKQGIGSAVLAAIIEEANRGALPVTLTVSKSNTDARRLYERLGFRAAVDHPMDVGMRRDPTS
jgi:ribosomal protein S18 acetylase RimI-like enzyme